MNQQLNIEGVKGFAVDLGGTKLAAARIVHGKVTERVQCATESNAPAGEQVDAIERLLIQVGWQIPDAVSVAVAGRVTAQGVWSAVNLGTLTSIQDTPIKELLKARLGCTVFVCNDAIAAAFAEARFGSGAGTSHFAYITVSTGVGGGIVIDGMPISSPNGLAGHVGLASSRLSSAICGSGRTATVESIAGGRAISRIANQNGHRVRSARDVFEAAADGANWALEITQTSAKAIAILCADLTTILGLQKVTLGGSIGLSPGYLSSVQEHLSFEPELFRPDIVAANLMHDSALVGAIALSEFSKHSTRLNPDFEK